MATEARTFAPAAGVVPRAAGKLGTERAWTIAFAFALAGAEVLGVLAGVSAGAAVDGAILLVLLNASVLGLVRPASLLAPTLALVPLLRILSVALPLRQVPQLAWYPLVGVPMLVAIALAAGTVGITRPAARLGRAGVPVQLVVGLAGVPLGAAAYAILRPPAIVAFTWPKVVLAALVLLVFAALVEELIFRRLLQDVVLRLFGLPGLLLSSGLYGAVYAGSLSVEFAAFMGGVGLLFALAARWTGALWGVVAAHTLLTVGLLVVWPAVGV
jgi:membrane protease YdiL (CAAX protease family)